MKPTITVLKRNLQGDETWRYTGVLLDNADGCVNLEAGFNRDDLHFMGIILKKGDRFVEWFYTDRWYNIFEIHDRDDDDVIKGWYCNIGLPMVFEADDQISYVDLALDLWVEENGAQTVLDEDEFEAQELTPELREKSLAALEELKRLFEKGRPPF